MIQSAECRAFCQRHYVHVETTGEGLCGCVFGKAPFDGYYAVKMDHFSALVRGVAEYRKRNPPGGIKCSCCTDFPYKQGNVKRKYRKLKRTIMKRDLQKELNQEAGV